MMQTRLNPELAGAVPLAEQCVAVQAPRMAVAVVNYNTREHLKACLESLGRQRIAHAVVVDNGSEDGSIEMVAADYPWVELVVSQANAGYGAAANQGIARTHSPYVLLLNSDTVLPPEALPRLTRYLDDHPGVAVAGPRLLNPGGTLQASCFPFPTPLNQLLYGTAFAALAERSTWLSARYLPAWSHDSARAVPWVLGAALAIRRTAFDEIGGFDESFFMYSEEVDLCYRMYQHNWQVHFAPVTNVVHARGASTAQRRVDMAVQKTRATAHFYRRHYSRFRLVQFRLVVTAGLLFSVLRDSLRFRTTHGAQRAGAGTDLLIARRVLAGVWREW